MEFKKKFPNSHDRDDPATGPPSLSVATYLARLREEPLADDGSSADEGTLGPKARCGTGELLIVGVECTSREERPICDLSGRWPIERRRYPESEPWKTVAIHDAEFSRKEGSAAMLTKFAWKKVESRPFEAEDVRANCGDVCDVGLRLSVRTHTSEPQRAA